MIRCALLTLRHDWASVLTLACSGLEFLTLSPAALGIDAAPNPFSLPEDNRADVILLTSEWRRWLDLHHPGRADRVMAVIAGSAGALVGVDGLDQFELGFEPGELEELASVIKFQGVFRDRELYNYDVGPWYPGANWSHKLRPKARQYATSELDKLRLSVPCLMIDLPPLRRSARRYESGVAQTIGREMSRAERVARNLSEEVVSKVIAIVPVGNRPLDVQCLAGLTNLQRLDAIRHLEGLSGTRGIAMIPDNFWGIAEDRGAIIGAQARRALVEQTAPYMRGRLSRTQYLRDLCRHRIVVAPAGYGELCIRHGEALRTGAALICQDLGHVETMFPFRDGENVVFCRHDLSDLRPAAERLLADEGERQRIAREGRRSFNAWSARWRDLLDSGITAHIREALGLREV